MVKKSKGTKPKFKRQESSRYKKLKGGWRKPRGPHNKVRKSLGGKPIAPKIGYRGNAVQRGLHPSGYKDVLVYNPSVLDDMDKAKQAVRIASGVGDKKAKSIMEKGEKLGLKILNPRLFPIDEEEEEEE
ncbi:MAG: 50S ribosomal protein L32e [Candidatus Hydrothermarchaeales archaeon]